MKAKFIKEYGTFRNDIFSDGNLKALRGWRDKEPEREYQITINEFEPKIIKLDSEKDYHTLKFLFQKYRIKFVE